MSKWRKRTVRDDRERTILHDGERYAWYAGPFKDSIDAFDYLAILSARGEVSEDDATVIGNSIFVRVAETLPRIRREWRGQEPGRTASSCRCMSAQTRAAKPSPSFINLSLMDEQQHTLRLPSGAQGLRTAASESLALSGQEARPTSR